MKRLHVDVERLVVWLLAVLIVAAVGVEAFVFYTGDVDQTAPQATFECAYDADARSLTVTHVAGDVFDDSGTRRLYLHARDADAPNSANLTWAQNGTGFRISAGDRFRLDDPAVDSDGDGDYFDGDATVGWHFEPNDTVELRWVGDNGDRATMKRCVVGNATASSLRE